MVNTETNIQSASCKENCEPQNYAMTPDLNVDKPCDQHCQNMYQSMPKL